MRKIRSQEYIEAKKKKNATYLGLGLILLMVLSTLGYSIVNNNHNNQNSKKISVDVGGLKFVRVNNYWDLQLQGKDFYFSSLPNETTSTNENISLSDYMGKTLYLVNYDYAYENLLHNVGGLVERYQEACLKGLDCVNKDLPTKTCEDNVIVFDKNSEGLTKKENCVFIGKNINKNIDVFSYKLLFG